VFGYVAWKQPMLGAGTRVMAERQSSRLWADGGGGLGAGWLDDGDTFWARVVSDNDSPEKRLATITIRRPFEMCPRAELEGSIMALFVGDTRTWYWTLEYGAGCNHEEKVWRVPTQRRNDVQSHLSLS
jgi:hypothetical protein